MVSILVLLLQCSTLLAEMLWLVNAHAQDCETVQQ
jgi:hypothetical protein